MDTLFDSRMFGRRLAPKEVVQALYEGLFHRAPDVAGAAGYRAAIEKGAPLARIVRNLVDSDEFSAIAEDIARTRRACFRPDEVLAAAYAGILGRSPDAHGREKYLDDLRRGRGLDSLVQEIAESREATARRAARMPGHAASAFGSGDVTILQTCDAVRYLPLLHCGRTANERYAARHGFTYSSFVGIKRGYHPWHACFNRLFMLNELAAAGYRGWAFYLDADAYVYDQTFDLRTYLDRHQDRSMIAAPGGTSQKWDINDGVFLLNLGHADAREIVDRWLEHYMATPDDALRAASEWEDVPSDQPRLHEIFMTIPRLIDDLLVEDKQFLNAYRSSFVRQVLRGNGLTLEYRLQLMQQDIGAGPSTA